MFENVSSTLTKNVSYVKKKLKSSRKPKKIRKKIFIFSRFFFGQKIAKNMTFLGKI